ncbi:TRAP transporter small permease subunit [Jannaschia ovalis]|uniref:TRAP transporter small permease protein n=1 Tax=Jannaschia ovalis TaxID=3038773 RepID=A0ABY8LEZ7_9RHOB|nr:TRAP transporter small permease subunit [Jannaschia sp. GRR-S6-38]WGH78900.1 TRAP transporter small permease subunit [Jannaschia sp. GRR-S6-38]
MRKDPMQDATYYETAAAPQVIPGPMQIAIPMAFTACFAWAMWRVPAFLMVFTDPGPTVDALTRRYAAASALDWLALAGVVLFAILGVMTVRRAPSEFEDWGVFDRLSVFIGRVTMLLIAALVCVMVYEVVLRYAFERPTLWANEMSLWMAGFIFILSGLYAMQQRSHIRIFLLYDLMPRTLQRVCDIISTGLIVLFAFFLFWGGYGEAAQKFARWETFGTAFDPPIPATLKPLILIVVALVALQAIANLIRDWNAQPVIHTAADDIDPDEIERLRRQVAGDE